MNENLLMLNTVPGVHRGSPVLTQGATLESAKAAVILIHGRGASALDILGLADELPNQDVAYFAPQAARNFWYPARFFEPLEDNEPDLSSSLAVIGALIEQLVVSGIPTEKIVLLGFSQGACLALEYAARNPQRYGGVVGLSGGLIGPERTPRPLTDATLENTPVFLGCSDVDFHIPLSYVQASTQFMRQLGGDVTERIYRGMGHTVNQDELDFVTALISSLS